MWYRIAIWNRQIFSGDRIIHQKVFRPEYRRGTNGTWQVYAEGGRNTWEKAYAVLEQHATPAKLAVRFVGTF